MSLPSFGNSTCKSRLPANTKEKTLVPFPSLLYLRLREYPLFDWLLFPNVMIAVVQRVSEASVSIANSDRAKIGPGLLVLVGIEDADNDEDIEWLAAKIVNLRIFNDAEGVMNVSLRDRDGDILLVSQFTLHASVKKGNRPSYIKASKPPIAIPLYEKLISALSAGMGKAVQTGEFGADMQVSLVNDGPVTIIIDTKNKA